MNATKNSARLIDDLAAHWTDAALEILKTAGVPAISIELELEIWHTLKDVLRAELRWQRAFRFSTLVSMGTLMEQVLRKATLLTARRFLRQSDSADFERRVRGYVRERRATDVERNLYAELVRQPALRSAFKPPTRTDYFPRLRVSALG